MQIRIGNKELKSNLMLAPMAGITDTVLRSMVRSMDKNCLLVTEMLSSEALVNNPKAPILASTEYESPLAFQLSGHKPHLMAKAAKIIENKADFIDVNMGCPVKKVVCGGDGSALMKTPQIAADIVKAIKDTVEKPVTVKFRLGWTHDTKNFVEFGKLMEDAGAQAITLHARTRSQMYADKADWAEIAKLVKEVSIPVYANGDITNIENALECLNLSKAAGLAIGRGALGNPYIFKQLEHYFRTGEVLPELTLSEKILVLKEHLNSEIAHRGEENGIKFFRKFYPYYIKGVRGGGAFRGKLVTEDNYQVIIDTLDEIVENEQKILHLSAANRE